MQTHEQTAAFPYRHYNLRHYTLQKFDGVYSILKRMYLENFYHHIITFHQNILNLLWMKKVMEN